MSAAVLFDRVVAYVALILLAPVVQVTAAAVRFTSPGPVIYRQTRIGQGGRPFNILKFRTMVDGADRLAASVSREGDPRMTPVGGFLRHWYLDELPQLVNVLRGDMRLVPRGPSYRSSSPPTTRPHGEVDPLLLRPRDGPERADQLPGLRPRRTPEASRP